MITPWAFVPILFLALGAPRAVAGSVDLPVQIGGAYSVPATSLREARYLSMVRQQYDFSCGSAALSTLLTYHYNTPVSEQTVFEEMYAQGEQEKIKQEGFSLLDMKRYLEKHGFEADGFEAPLDKLQSAGIPAIVLINDNGYNHFVVVKGIRDQRVLLGDPSGGSRVMSRARFESIWVNQILFVISSHADSARFNMNSEWRVTAQAPLANGINRSGLGQLVIPKFSSADF